jgi:peptidoglycan/xylan/chitin deacetylase (PgdA/CDA1 family)
MRGPDWLAAVLSRSGIPARLPSRGPLIVMYHGIGGPDGVTAEAFEHQITALTERRRVVPLPDAVDSLGQRESGGLAAITFDDGYRDFAELALPVLRRRRLHATLFVPAGWLGKKNAWASGQSQRDILTARELGELGDDSVTIGAHGLTHVRLAGMAAGPLQAETSVARRMLEEACGRAVTLYAYPHGQRDDFDIVAERAVADAGFIAACSTRFGRGSRPAERFRLRRVGIEPGDSLARVEQKLDGAYDWVAAKEALGGVMRRALRRWGQSWNIRSSTALRSSGR